MNIHMEFTHTHSCRKLTKRVQALNYYIFATTTALKLGMSHAFAAKSAFISCWDMVTLGVWHDEELPSNCVSKYKIQKINIQNKKAMLTSRVLTERAWVDWLFSWPSRSEAWDGGIHWRTTTTTVLLWQPGLFIFFLFLLGPTFQYTGMRLVSSIYVTLSCVGRQ